MHTSDDRTHVMLAVRLEADVAQHHDLVIATGFLESTLEIVAWMVLVAGKPLLIGAHHPRRRRAQPFAVGVVAGPANERAYGRLSFFARHARRSRFRCRKVVICRRTLGIYGLVHSRISRPARPMSLRTTSINKMSTLAPIVAATGKGCAR